MGSQAHVCPVLSLVSQPRSPSPRVMWAADAGPVPVHVVLGGEFADGGDDSVEPPDSVPLDGSDLALEGPQHLEV